MLTGKRVLVVAAHPDDDAIGCGGTLTRHVEDGAEVAAIYFTDGVSARDKASDASQKIRSSSARQVAEALKLELLAAYCYPDNCMDTVPFLELVKTLEKEIDRFQPDLIYTHFSGDLNIDHRIVAQVVFTACRPQPPSSIQGIYSFEVPSSTGWAWSSADTVFAPTRYVDITECWEKKKLALELYKDEIKPYPHARSIKAIEALARFRGANVGVQMAEAFIVEREIL